MWLAARIAARVPAVLLALALAAALPLPSRAESTGRLRALDVELGAPTVQFAVQPWQGHSAVSAFTLRALPDGRAELAVHRIVLDAAGWHEVGRWPLPPDLEATLETHALNVERGNLANLTEDLAPGEIIFAATGVSNGDMIRGVRFLA